MSQSKCSSLDNSSSNGSPNTEDENILVPGNPKRTREELTDSDNDDDLHDEDVERKRVENEPGFLLAEKKKRRINKRIQVLRYLVPNCPEVSDEDIVLDKTIEHCQNHANIMAGALKRPMMTCLCGVQHTRFSDPMDLGMWPAVPPGFMNPPPAPTNVRPAETSHESGDGESEPKNKG